MPLFRYTCDDCDAQLELFVQSSTTPACPHCESEKLTKRFTNFSVGTASAGAPCMTGSCGMPAPPMGGCAGGMCGL